MKMNIYPLSLQGVGNPQADFRFFKGSKVAWMLVQRSKKTYMDSTVRSQVAKSSGKKSSWFLILRNKTVEQTAPNSCFCEEFSVAPNSVVPYKTPSLTIPRVTLKDSVCLRNIGKNDIFVDQFKVMNQFLVLPKTGLRSQPEPNSTNSP